MTDIATIKQILINATDFHKKVGIINPSGQIVPYFIEGEKPKEKILIALTGLNRKVPISSRGGLRYANTPLWTLSVTINKSDTSAGGLNLFCILDEIATILHEVGFVLKGDRAILSNINTDEGYNRDDTYFWVNGELEFNF